MGKHCHLKESFIRKNWKQAGADLGQAQVKLEVVDEVLGKA